MNLSVFKRVFYGVAAVFLLFVGFPTFADAGAKVIVFDIEFDKEDHQMQNIKSFLSEDELQKILPMFKHLKTMINPIGDINDTTNLNTAPTILDLISHTAGFSYHFLGDPVGIAYDKVGFLKPANTSLEEEIEKLANIPLLFQPKQKWQYSVSVDILGRVIEVITKQSLRDYLMENIFYNLT